MMRGLSKNGRETLIGAVVIGTLALALWLNAADRKMRERNPDGYPLEAFFERSDGLSLGAEVRIAGVAVGSVAAQSLDPRYRTRLTLHIAHTVQIPTDSAAIIETDGLLGAKYIEIQPGGDEEMLHSGDEIRYTQSSLVIEDLLSKIVAMAKNRRAQAAEDAAKAKAAPSLDGQPSSTTGTPDSSLAPQAQ